MSGPRSSASTLGTKAFHLDSLIVPAAKSKWQSRNLELKGLKNSVGCSKGKCANIGITAASNDQTRQTSLRRLKLHGQNKRKCALQQHL